MRDTNSRPSPYVHNQRGIGAHQILVRWAQRGARVLDVGCADG